MYSSDKKNNFQNMSLPAEQEDSVSMDNIDVNAHLKVEMVLNDDGENDEKFLNDIICYDSDADSSQEYDQDDVSQMQSHYEIRQVTTSETSSDLGKNVKIKKKSNAEQMRKYRAKQRNDPDRYRIYLERERVRNYRRKYEKRMKAAQDRAIELGLPYIILEPFSVSTKRGRKPKYPCGGTILLPEKFEESDSLHIDPYDGVHSMPVKVELTESNDVYQERKPHISVVNIDKLTNHPRTALQTLLPQELNDRERTSNFIKLDHDYVRIKTEPIDEYLDNLIKINQRSTIHVNKKSNKLDRDELLKLQEQCRNFVSLKSASSSNDLTVPRSPRIVRRKSSKKRSKSRETFDLLQNYSAEHEDLDDLFKELEEVANKEETKKKKSKTSPTKKQHGEYSLTVQMPVQSMTPPENENPHFEKSEDSNVKSNGSKIDNIFDDEMRWWKKILRQQGMFMSEDHKEEQQTEQVIDDFSENIKEEPVSSDDDF